MSNQPALPYYPSGSREYRMIRYRVRVHQIGERQSVFTSKRWKLLNWEKVKASWTEYNRRPENVERRKNYYQKNKERISTQKKIAWQKNIVKNQENHRLYYLKNREEIKKKTKQYYNAWKNYNKCITISHYSNGTMCCKNCGENIIELFTIDHVNGGGHKHRKQIGQANIFVWLRRHNFPDGYQILCYNCNCVQQRVTPKRYEEIMNELRGRKLYMDCLKGIEKQ